MKKILILLVVTLSLLIVACGPTNDTVNEEMADADNQDQAPPKTDKKADANQDKVNFKCVMGEVQEYYFYKNKIKIESPATEGWVIDGIHYIKIPIGETEYLVTGGDTGGEDITNEDMQEMYRAAALTPGLDCTLNVVTEADVTLPDLEIITSEEMGALIGASMMP